MSEDHFELALLLAVYHIYSRNFLLAHFPPHDLEKEMKGKKT
jgi:hypothetical protein